jgi:hypothetical protein
MPRLKFFRKKSEKREKTPKCEKKIPENFWYILKHSYICVSNKNTNMDIQLQYRELVEKRCEDYRWHLNVHVKDVMVSLLMTRDKTWVGGDFVQSVLANNLREAVLRADDEIVKHLKHMVIARDNFHLN